MARPLSSTQRLPLNTNPLGGPTDITMSRASAVFTIGVGLLVPSCRGPGGTLHRTTVTLARDRCILADSVPPGASEAARCAELFVRSNGYTRHPISDTASLQAESLQLPSSPEMLASRHGQLPDSSAWLCLFGAEWVALFPVLPTHPYAHLVVVTATGETARIPPGLRSVHVGLNLTSVYMRHTPVMDDSTQLRRAGCQRRDELVTRRSP